MDVRLQLTREECEALIKAIDAADEELCYDLKDHSKFPEGLSMHLRLEGLRAKIVEALQ